MRERSSWYARLCYAGVGLFGGLFLAVRLQAFLVQAREISLSQRQLLLLGPLLALLGALLAPAIREHLRRWAFGGQKWTWIIYFVCVIICLRLRGITLDEAIVGGGFVLHPGMTKAVLVGGGLLLGLFVLHLFAALWACGQGALLWLRELTKRDAVAVVALWVLVNLAVYAYARGSATIYSWDSAIYWRSTDTLAGIFREQGFAAALRAVYDSIFVSDYNYTIGLLCVPFALLFGPSRLVYLMSIANFCLFPMLLLLWGYARSCRKGGTWLFWGAALSLPSLFYTSVTGYVDIAGAAVALGALLLWLGEKGKGRFGRFLLIGTLVALAVVLRRWYAFLALAMLVTLIADSAVFRRSAAPVLGYLCGFAFPLLFFFQTFVSKRLLADYAKMYAAYDLGLGVDFRILFRYYGIFLLVAALMLGIWLLLRGEDRQKGLILLLEPILCFFLFTRVQSHGQQHLLLYVPALACLLITGFHRLAQRSKLGYLAVALVVVPTAVSPAIPRVQSGIIQDYPLFIPLPNFAYAPPRRADAQEMVALVRRLDEFGAAGKRVGLLASSFLLNTSALRNAEDSLNLKRISDVDRSYLVELPGVDQRDGFGDVLYTCDILAVADPIQLHLGEENQQVVWAPAHCLLEGEAIAGAYERLDETFRLEADDITIHFFAKRREPTSEEKRALTDKIRQVHPEMAMGE